MRRKISKMKSNLKSKIIILITVGIFLALLPINTNIHSDGIAFDNDILKTSAVSGKISINGNSGWASFKAAGNCTGNGIYSDPYVIEDLEIDGGGTGDCILIQNSDVYFRIENCTLYDSVGSPDHSGILLKYTGNGTIFENNCSFNRFGITFDPNCENNTIQGNSINSNTEYGINIYESSNNCIEENIVNSNGNMGINLDPNSQYNEIVNNTVNFNGWLGIHMQANSTNNLILSNNCSFNNEGISVRTPNNTISGNFVEYNSGYGIHLWNSDSGPNALSNNITKNIVKYNNYGFLLDGSSAFNVIEGNQIIDNTGTGVAINAGCFDNLIFNNTFINNLYANAEDDGSNNNWNSTALGNYWDDYSGKDADDDGMGDTPYTIPGTTGSQDNFPIWWDAPIISIDSPTANATFSNTAPNYEISIEGVPQSMWCTIEGIVGNFPIIELNGTIDQDTWDSLDDGDITITFYAQDSESEIGSTSIIVTKNIPSTPDGIPGYNLFFLLGTISVVAIVLSTKLKKCNK